MHGSALTDKKGNEINGFTALFGKNKQTKKGKNPAFPFWSLAPKEKIYGKGEIVVRTGVIYARYSCDKQTEQSIEGQLRICNDYAARNDIVIVENYIDRATTGTNDNRAEFQRMMKDSAIRFWTRGRW